MKKAKIGKGYFRSGYGRGFKPNSVVYLINEKAYVKDSSNKPYYTDLEGYIMVNVFDIKDGIKSFSEVGIISEHRKHQ